MARDLDPRRPERSLRRHMIMFAAALTAVAFLIFLSLKLVSDVIRRQADELKTAGDASEVSERARTDLTEYSRVSNLMLIEHSEARAAERTDTMVRVIGDLDELRRLVEPQQKATVEKAASGVRSYFDERQRTEASRVDIRAAATAAAPSFDGALAALTDVVHAESAARDARAARSHSLNVAGNYLGWALGLSSLLLMFAAYRAVFRPLMRLSGAMQRFSAGDRKARADPKQGVDLASLASTFNEMADIITTQHTHMLEFLGRVSRELKNPVQVMRMALQDLGNPKLVPSPEKMRSRLALLSREVARTDRLVDGFLDASQIEWGRLDLQQGRQDLRACVTGVVKVYETFSNIHQFTLSMPDDPVWASFDPGRMTQVFHTLMSNAIQFSPRGGMVDVTLVTDGGKGKPSKEAILSITDHGAGIGEREKAKLFEPFHEVTGARQIGASTSVALSVAQRIVEAHGGRIEVDSKVGEGATFRVRLPLAFEPAKEELTHPGVARAARPAPSHP